ncbi:MAG: DNA mismatch repair endonuclease MutL [Planctomycetota bacterium]
MSAALIRQLPRDVVERIAAGEVVERPASVIKELLENALDAGATEIHVSVEGGGLVLLRVADNGSGIAAEELPLALAAHATSKLSDVDDLQHIASFGFRGEALSSIAAVSRLRILSRTPDTAAGCELSAVAGQLETPRPAACTPGTVIEVRDLFFNTPARRQFLSSAGAEAARCREVCAALCLIHPELRLRFASDGSERLVVAAGSSLADRLTAIHGEDFVRELVPVQGAVPGLGLEGFVSLPSAARARPRVQQLFVNRRLVRDRAVAAAVRSGCQDFLPGSLQPSWVLALTIDPARVDVNVHPTKAEVRFRDPDAVFRVLRSACRQALLDADLRPTIRAEHLPYATSQTAPLASSSAAPFATTLPSTAPRGAFSGGLVPAESIAEGQTAPLALSGLRPAARYLQVLETYLLHDDPDGLVLIDQHALHERILYSRLQRDLAEGKLESQALLLPVPVRLTPTLHARALELAAELQRLGLQVVPFGPDTVAVQAVPTVLRRESLDELLRALIDPPELHGGIPHGLDRRLFTMACHAAVKSGDRLQEQEIEALLRQGAELEHDATCPHGRPTRLHISRVELERLFKRSGF